MYGTNLDQVGPNMAKLDLLGQVARQFAVFCLLGKAPLTNLDQVGPVLFPTVFRALLNIVMETPKKKQQFVGINILPLFSTVPDPLQTVKIDLLLLRRRIGVRGWREETQ